MDESNEQTIQNTSFDLSSSVILCMDSSGSRVGCSLLDMENKKLCVLQQDLVVNPLSLNEELMSVFHFLNIVFDLNLLLISTRIDSDFKANIISMIAEGKLNIKIDTFSTSKFNPLAIKGKLFSLDHQKTENYTLLSNLLNAVNTSTTIGSVSCLLTSCLDQLRFLTSTDIDITDLVTSIEYLSINEHSFILDIETVYSLELLPQKKSQFQKSIKDGIFSLLELLGQYVVSEQGVQLLKKWILSPLKNLDKIQERSDFLQKSLTSSSSNIEYLYEISKNLNKLPNIYTTLNAIEMGKSNYSTWIQFSRYLQLMVDIFFQLKLLTYPDGVPYKISLVFQKIEAKVIKGAVRQISTIIDLDESKCSKTLVIQNGFNNDLDEHRKIYNNLEAILEQVAAQVNRKYFTKCGKENLFNVVYVPQLGYLLCLENEDLPMISQEEDMEHVFQTDTHIYYKNAIMLEMDEEYGDIYTIIQDMEIEIIQSLNIKIITELKEILLQSVVLFSELEVLISWTLVSFEKNYCQPEFTDKKCLIIEQGRHPIYETLVTTYIPNDLDLSSDLTCGIITGANMSGKTNFLISSGLNVLLAHLGCFVPCLSMKLSLIDKLLTRIWTRESLLKTQSTFYLDSQQMATCICMATDKSLILIDEFGKGTDVLDGPSLFGGVIQHLTSVLKPRVLACTHYHELFGPNILGSSLEGVKFYSTQIIITPKPTRNIIARLKGKENDDLISFLYTVKEGISTDSYGIICAENSGVDTEIITRAKEISNIMNNGGNIIEQCSRLSEVETLAYTINENIAIKFLEWELEKSTLDDPQELKLKLQEILQPLLN